MKTAREHDRFIEDLGDDTPCFRFYIRSSHRSLGHMQSPMSAFAGLLSEHELEKHTKVDEAIARFVDGILNC